MDDDVIKVVSEMCAICHKPQLYTKNGTAEEIVEYLNGDDQFYSCLLKEKWPDFRDRCLVHLDLSGVTALGLWDIWKAWTGDRSPQPYGTGLFPDGEPK